MKKRYLIIGSLAFMQYFARAQPGDTTTQKPRRIDVELVYNHYTQDGDNSAVTGGTGTERLTVFGPAVTYRYSTDKKAISFDLGADVISSASTDNIDFVKSSASRIDRRVYINGDYQQSLKNLAIHGGAGFSIESDYLSLSGKVGAVLQNDERLRTLSLDFLYFNDDLRWGRLNSDYRKPVTLIYPVELRDTTWFDIYRRHSYNLKLGFTQVLNKRNVLGIFPELVYQTGLLSTPFHRIFFANDEEVVENLPRRRTKTAIAVRLNSFVGSALILRNTINMYHDSFGILAASFENETIVKLSPLFSLMPGIRLYTQHAADAFAPFKAHDPSEAYYTSDYDLSAFRTYTATIGFKWRQVKDSRKGNRTKTFTTHYYYTHRTNGLDAHVVAVSMLWETMRR